jgi:hypothetical protein
MSFFTATQKARKIHVLLLVLPQLGIHVSLEFQSLLLFPRNWSGAISRTVRNRNLQARKITKFRALQRVLEYVLLESGDL